jgi:two-component system sensor histidine kinase KdpD
MNRMIENLLDLSKLQAGALAANADWLDPRELVEASLDEVVPSDQEARVHVTLAHDAPLVRGDASQLQRVVVNLVENALKFSPGEQPVEVSVERAGKMVEVAIADHGPGIPEADRDRIFEPFYRSADQPGVTGSGLGLAIALGLAEANGCRLSVGPTPGGGSRFVLALPVPAGKRRT